MEWNSLLLWSLILVPLALALCAAGAPGSVRRVLVGAAAVVTAGLGVAMGARYFGASDGTFACPALPASWASLGWGLELLMIVAILAVAVRIRRWPIILLAVAQLGLAVAEEWISRAKGVHSAMASPFRVDSLAVILVLVVSVIGAIIVYYAIGYMRQHAHHAPRGAGILPVSGGEAGLTSSGILANGAHIAGETPASRGTPAPRDGRFFLVLIGFLGMMNGLVMADDLKWFGFFWEATTLCSFLLIGHDGTDQARRNAARALLINSFGGVAMLVAGVLLAVNGIGGSIRELTEAAVAANSSANAAILSVTMLPVALLCLAAFTKSAQLPFQSWLLGAMVAPTPVSALLHSATMVKAGSYLVLRLAPAFYGTKLSTVIAVAGAFTFVVTSALACGQRNGKKVLAYSTIANLGLIVMCAGINTPLAYAAALMTLCFHAASKGLLFMCVGTIEQKIGSRDIEDMGGIMSRMPFTTAVALIGMVSMLVPPFGMLLSKWMAIESAIHNPLVLVLMIAGAAFTVVFWAKWIGRIQTVSYHPKYVMETAPRSMIVTMGVLAAMVVVGGVCAVPIMNGFVGPLAMEAVHPNMYEVSTANWTPRAVPPSEGWARFAQTDAHVMWPLFVFPAAALLLGAVTYFRFKPEQVRLPFLCGENVENAKPRYSFHGLADQPTIANATSLYHNDVFSEGRVTFWSNLLAAMVLLAMFGILLP